LFIQIRVSGIGGHKMSFLVVEYIQPVLLLPDPAIHHF